MLGYFRGCFNFHPENESGWHAGNLTIDSDVDPLEHADFHAGVHLIRRYYPEYQPTPRTLPAGLLGKEARMSNNVDHYRELRREAADKFARHNDRAARLPSNGPGNAGPP